jgi:dipeptidyl aminopeptidase/acylaminoacyl peptidase
LPPIITIHGDKDSVVPYSHAVRLHQALDKAGVPNELITIKDGDHGQFTVEQTHDASGRTGKPISAFAKTTER